MNGIRAETVINRTAAARLKWPEGLSAASWLHETALRLYPDSKYAEEHSTGGPTTPAKEKIGAAETRALRIMRKVYEATGGQPQRWESLGNLGTVTADAAQKSKSVGGRTNRHTPICAHDDEYSS